MGSVSLTRGLFVCFFFVEFVQEEIYQFELGRQVHGSMVKVRVENFIDCYLLRAM